MNNYSMKNEIKKRVFHYSTNIKNYLFGSEKYCIVCNRSFHSFKPYNNVPDSKIFKENHIIGAGYRKNYMCPYCETIDRERWQQYVITNHTNILTKQSRVLHFAPEKNIYDILHHNCKTDYYPCDILPWDNFLKIDITNIPFQNNYFDYVITNHVLEHVKNENEAVKEVMRVLKKDGTWIFSFPICTNAITFEDDSITEPSSRLNYFGQIDHVRLYGNDYIERFQIYGLSIKIFQPADELSDEIIEKNGFIPDDTIIFAKKN